MKKCLVNLLFLYSCLMVAAQPIEDAKKMLYYERYKSAIKILEPIVNTDSKNAEAAY